MLGPRHYIQRVRRMFPHMTFSETLNMAANLYFYERGLPRHAV